MQEFKKSGVEAAIFVQCLNGSLEEIQWVENIASKHSIIKGIVGGLDLTQDPEILRQQIRRFPLLVGLRHILDFEDEDWLLRDDVQRGLQVVAEEGKVFDCLVRPNILKHVATIGKSKKKDACSCSFFFKNFGKFLNVAREPDVFYTVI